MHSIGTKTQHHSLEAIDPTQTRGIYFIAPIVDFILLPTLIIFYLFAVGIPSDYLSGRDMCPGVHFVRRQLYHFDSGVAYMVKDKFAWACNLEDGYFRLIIDTWVRAIKTDSDSFLLLISALLRAMMFHALAIKVFVVPAVVLVNALASFIFQKVLQIAAHYYAVTLGDYVPAPLQEQLILISQNLQQKFHWLFDPSDFPPPTIPRIRPRNDYVDFQKYWMGRQARFFQYYYGAGEARMQALTAIIPVIAVVVRFLCITTSFDWYIRVLCFLPGDVTKAGLSVPIDAIGHVLDKVATSVIARAVPFSITHVPISYIICWFLMWLMIGYPWFKNWIDTRNWYGGHCGKAPISEFTAKVRWFPKTFEPEKSK